MQMRRTTRFFFLFLISVLFLSACGGGGSSAAPPASTPASLPAVQAASADNLSITGATLHGSVNPNGSATKAYFQWTTDSTFTPANVHSTDEQTIGSDNALHPISFVLGSQAPGTKIYYRVYAYNSAGAIYDSVPLNFTTLALPPVATTDNASLITTTTATINGSVNPNGLQTDYHFAWGTTTGMTSPPTSTQSIAAGKFTAQPVSANLTGLTAGTTYYYQLVTSNSAGPGNGTMKSFSASLNPPPTANAGPDQSVFMGHTATLDGSGSSPSVPSQPIASYQWTQLPGTAVTLSDPNSQTPTFTAPDVAKTGEILQFQLTVTDNVGLSQSDTVNVAVKWGFLDDFSTDTTGTYGKFTFPVSGDGSTFTYDSTGQRASVVTGTGKGIIAQSAILPSSLQTNTAVFSLDFTPTGSFSTGRYIVIRLNDTGDTYYEFSTGDASIKKVRLGVVVDSVAFPYYQDTPGTTYNIKFTFGQEIMAVTAFGGTVSLVPPALTNTSSISMSYFEVWTSEMNAYYDNIKLEAVP